MAMFQGASMRKDRNTTEGVAAVKRHAIGVLQSLGARRGGEGSLSAQHGGEDVGVNGRKRARCDEGLPKGDQNAGDAGDDEGAREGEHVMDGGDDEGAQEGAEERVMDGGDDEGAQEGSQCGVSCADFEPMEHVTFGKVRN
jgi:hypothetical protein